MEFTGSVRKVRTYLHSNQSQRAWCSDFPLHPLLRQGFPALTQIDNLANLQACLIEKVAFVFCRWYFCCASPDQEAVLHRDDLGQLL